MLKNLKNRFGVDRDNRKAVDMGRHTIALGGRIRMVDIDNYVACNLVDILYKNVTRSIKQNRSSVKINALTKGMISGVLDSTRDGTKEYVLGMTDDDIRLLLDEMEIELKRRRK